MRDRQVQYPNRFRLNAVSGQENVYDLVAVPGTITQAGTALNKANLLSDDTAAALGLSGDPTVDDALAGIANKRDAWTVLANVTTAEAANVINIALTDSLKNYKALYIRVENATQATSTSQSAPVYMHLGTSADGFSLLSIVSASKAGDTASNASKFFPDIKGIEAQKMLFWFSGALSSAGTVGSPSVSAVNLADFPGWDCSHLCLEAHYSMSGGMVRPNLAVGLHFELWGIPG